MTASTSTDFWLGVRDADYAVPEDRRLDDLAADLTRLLGSPDPAERDEVAYRTLATWVSRGVFDDVLSGLGDGMAAGLSVGVGESGTPSVYRRSFSALILAECLARDNLVRRVPASTVLAWGDRLAGWYVRERDLRGWVEGEGWAHAVAHGADALAVLAASPHLDFPELTVVLDVIADRLAETGGTILAAGEPDRMAAATVAVLRRGLVPFLVVTPWVVRIRNLATLQDVEGDPYPRSANAEAFLRALYLQLALATAPPPERADVVLAVSDALRITNQAYLGRPEREVTD